MSNFNYGRTIDLRQYLPDVVREVMEFKAIFDDAETPEVQEEWQAAEDAMDDQFISSSTEYGIARREEMLGIKPYATDTLEDRKFRLLARYVENLPYTRKRLKELLDTLCGNDGYTIEYDTTNFGVTVKVALSEKRQKDAVDDLLERILPYNMTFSSVLLYNTWEKLKPYKWGDLTEYAWVDLKESEVFE